METAAPLRSAGARACALTDGGKANAGWKPVRRDYLVGAMKRFFLLSLGWLTGVALMANPAFVGRWRLDPAQSSALDGWTTLDLVVDVRGPLVELRHDMAWRTTKVTGTNTVDTTQPVAIPNFFRIDQRHMAVYAQPAKSAATTASWIDGHRTLRIEALVPLEVSQGDATQRIYSEYRLLEGDQALLLIELHAARPRPLVYRFTKVTAEEAKK